MQELTHMVASLSLMTMGTMALEMLIPAGEMRAYVRFVFALVSMLVILAPFLRLLQALRGVAP